MWFLTFAYCSPFFPFCSVGNGSIRPAMLARSRLGCVSWTRTVASALNGTPTLRVELQHEHTHTPLSSLLYFVTSRKSSSSFRLRLRLPLLPLVLNISPPFVFGYSAQACVVKGVSPRRILETNGSIPGVTVGSLSYCHGGLRYARGAPLDALREASEKIPLLCSSFVVG